MKDCYGERMGRSSDLFEATLMDSVRVLTESDHPLVSVLTLLFYPASSNLHYCKLMNVYGDLGVNSATKQRGPLGQS